MSSTEAALEKYRQEKRQDTLQRANDAIRSLQLEGRDVNFKSVSRVSGITRKTLYKIPEIREKIEELRAPSAQTGEIDLSKFYNKILQLEQEIKQLREKLADCENLQEKISHLKELSKSL